MLNRQEQANEHVYPEKGETRPAARFAKRCMDIVIGLLLLFLSMPLMIIISAIIVICDGAPVIYVHKRIGRNGKVFGCLKFRSMVRDSDRRLATLLACNPAAAREWDEKQKLRNDPRILPYVGGLLRSSSLDELPQFWNVIRGDMSLVGPRPVVAEELARYGRATSLYLSVRPGLTVLWQIGERSNDDYEERVRKDIGYIRNWSLSGDLAIIIKTARVVLSGPSKDAF